MSVVNDLVTQARAATISGDIAKAEELLEKAIELELQRTTKKPTPRTAAGSERRALNARLRALGEPVPPPSEPLSLLRDRVSAASRDRLFFINGRAICLSRRELAICEEVGAKPEEYAANRARRSAR